ncbi:MAG: histidine phosphatase family protein [Patescibacteria group bacterium]|nr:histidine phosphatase family protein [Patescibacteria group bacterium]
MKLYFVRHGETHLNAQGVHQGESAELSDYGMRQAKRLAERCKHLGIEKILTSSLIRAKQTAQIIAESIQQPISETPLLVEVKRPTVIEGMLYDHPDAVAIKRQIYERFHDPAFRHSDEETFVDLRDRASLLIHHILSFKEKTILLVSHGDFIKVIVSVMIFGHDLDPKIALKFYEGLRMTNTGITVCELVNHHWKLITWNDQAHLGE